MSRQLIGISAVALFAIVGSREARAENSRVVILYDAFGRDGTFVKDWGFSALIEHGGKRVLFDTGNDPAIFAANVRAAKVDLRKLDFVVISHRHLDHTAGLEHLLKVNPAVTIYAPKETFGPFGSTLPSGFYRKDALLAEQERYFGGHPPEPLKFGSAWPTAKFIAVENNLEIAPGVHLIALVSDTPGTKELRELSLALDTAEGIVLVAGCSHPGVEKIVEAAAHINPRVSLVLGGFHMPAAPDEQIAKVATALHDTWHVERLAPGHCTGEPAFAHFKKIWGENYLHAGVGSVLELPPESK
jgi:7,8-dihydropterin-6-yl-methyl-4-(beta-D-ribofuranosyl)aminobenzene 5'-phosphate synthase